MKSRYSLFISACKGADSQGKFVYLHGRGEFSGARVHIITVNAQEIRLAN